MIEEQVQKWEMVRGVEKKEKASVPTITLSREPGSGGKLVAREIADRLGLDLFHREIIQEMSESAQISTRVLETLDEKGLSVLDDWISTLVNEKHLWPDQYLHHLLKVVGAIGKHGHAVIVGRGANFILPSGETFRVRVVSPQVKRFQNVAQHFGVSLEEARRRVLRAESDRRAFVRKYFHADIAEPTNYDLVINTGTLSIDAAAEAIASALVR
jgi:cytidylate kinase